MSKDINLIKYNIAFFLRAMMLLHPIMLLFYQYNGLSSYELFFFQGIFYLTSILAEIPVGYFANNFSRKKLLITSFSIYLGITFLWLSFKGFWIVLIGEILFGISKIIMDNVMSGYLYDYLDKNNQESKMNKYYGHLNSFLALGTAVAAIIGTTIYSFLGIKSILVTEIFIISITIALISSLPNIKGIRKESLRENISIYLSSTKNILNNENIKYHILLSGIFTACSILFALSFQPLIQKSFLPIFMFGVVAFLNHSVRSISSYISGYLKNFSINATAKFLLIAYSAAFILLIQAFTVKNPIFSTFIIVIICTIIGVQLIFTIHHISRLHTFVTTENRGTLMSINNFVSRSLAALVLITSKLYFEYSAAFNQYFAIVLVVFFIFSLYLAKKINNLGAYNHENYSN